MCSIFRNEKFVGDSVKENTICNLMICAIFSGIIDEHYIVDYIENREKYIKKGRGRDFKDAVARMDEYIQDPLVRLSTI